MPVVQSRQQHEAIHAFHFPGKCADIIHIGWHPTYEGRSLVSVGRDLYAVSGAEAKPLPEVSGRPYDVGMTAQDMFLVRTAESKVPVVEQNGRTGVDVDGTFMQVDSVETATIYRSYRYEGETWQLVEVLAKPANQRPDRTEEWDGIGTTTTSMHPGVHGTSTRAATSDEEAALTAAAPSFDTAQESSWRIATTKHGDVAYRMTGANQDQPSLPLMQRKSDQWAHIQAIRYKVADGMTLEFREGYLLVSRVGTRPYVYDLASGKVAYKSVTAGGVLFWPHFERTDSNSTPE